MLAQGGNLLQGFHSVPRGNGITDLKQIFAVRHARHAAHKRFIHSVGNTGAGIQDRQCITHGAIGQADVYKRQVLTKAYAEQIGADFYAKDAKASADYAKQIFG